MRVSAANVRPHCGGHFLRPCQQKRRAEPRRGHRVQCCQRHPGGHRHTLHVQATRSTKCDNAKRMWHTATHGSTGLRDMTHSGCRVFLRDSFAPLLRSFVAPRQRKTSPKAHETDCTQYSPHLPRQQTHGVRMHTVHSDDSLSTSAMNTQRQARAAPSVETGTEHCANMKTHSSAMLPKGVHSPRLRR